MYLELLTFQVTYALLLKLQSSYISILYIFLVCVVSNHQKEED
jgi:hypothetical protein